MKANNIDDILASEKKITPSPDFLTSVMRAVRRQAATLPPFKFPWLRVLPAILAMFVALMRLAWDLVGFLSEPDVLAELNEQLQQFADLAAQFGVQWVVLAVAITVISLMLSISLVGSEQHATSDSPLRRILRAIGSIVRRTS